MELYHINTNCITKETERKIIDAIEKGKAVSVGSSCIGHTRAMMIETQGERICHEAGATNYIESEFGTKYWYK